MATTTPDVEASRRPDLVERDFSAERPNELWVADLTYLRCFKGVVFFAFVLDGLEAANKPHSPAWVRRSGEGYCHVCHER